MAAVSADVIVRRGARRVAARFLAEGSSGRTVVLCHPAPGSGILDPDPEATRASGLALLGVDRPGYGRSDPMPTSLYATVDSAADDIAAVLEHVTTTPSSVVGWSAGGRVALALAARHPGLVGNVVVLGTPAPHEEVAWLLPEQEAAMASVRDLPAPAAHAALADQFSSLLDGDPSEFDALGLLAVGHADGPALAQAGARERIDQMLSHAFLQGVTGLASDILGYSAQPWGFEPEAVRARALLLYGSSDPVAGVQHGEWWQERLPDARLEVVPDAGHLLILSTWQRVLLHAAGMPSELD